MTDAEKEQIFIIRSARARMNLRAISAADELAMAQQMIEKLKNDAKQAK